MGSLLALFRGAVLEGGWISFGFWLVSVVESFSWATFRSQFGEESSGGDGISTIGVERGFATGAMNSLLIGGKCSQTSAAGSGMFCFS